MHPIPRFVQTFFGRWFNQVRHLVLGTPDFLIATHYRLEALLVVNAPMTKVTALGTTHSRMIWQNNALD